MTLFPYRRDYRFISLIDYGKRLGERRWPARPLPLWRLISRTMKGIGDLPRDCCPAPYLRFLRNVLNRRYDCLR